jgi:hypothetical protein
MKKIICILLAILTCLTIIPLSACKETTALTTENYTKFLRIDYKLENCVVDGNTYYCSIVVSTKAKNGVKFTDAEIGFNIFCPGTGFSPYNAELDKTISHYIYNPSGSYRLILDETGYSTTTVSFRSTSARAFPSTSKIKFTPMKILGKVTY